LWSIDDRPDWFSDDAETTVHWREQSISQHRARHRRGEPGEPDRRTRRHLEPVGIGLEQPGCVSYKLDGHPLTLAFLAVSAALDVLRQRPTH
jgi:hypothetical protein